MSHISFVSLRMWLLPPQITITRETASHINSSVGSFYVGLFLFYMKDGNLDYAKTLFCKFDFFTFLPLLNSIKINPVDPDVLIFVGRTHSRRIWSCQNISNKILCWVWSLVHSCESETERCKSATSWQQQGRKSFYSKSPWVTLPFEWPCESLYQHLTVKWLWYTAGEYRVCPGIGDDACLF